MSEIDDPLPAFPQPATADGHRTNASPGMTLRDYFAAMAMSAIVSNPRRLGAAASKSGRGSAEFAAAAAYSHADAMIVARSNPS